MIRVYPNIVIPHVEVEWAKEEGRRRQAEAEAKNRVDMSGLTDQTGDPTLHIDGVLGELAFARWLGFPWGLPYGGFQCPDYGPYEVRASRHRDKAHLILRPASDKDNDAPYVLATIEDLNIVMLRGWRWAFEAKIEEFWRWGRNGRDDAWWVPRVALHPMNTLPRMEEEHGEALRRLERRMVRWYDCPFQASRRHKPGGLRVSS